MTTKKKRTRTDAQRRADDAALIATGEPLADLYQLVGITGFNYAILRSVLNRFDVTPRYVCATRHTNTRYCITDVVAALALHADHIKHFKAWLAAKQVEAQARAEERKQLGLEPTKTSQRRRRRKANRRAREESRSVPSVASPVRAKPLEIPLRSAAAAPATPEVLIIRRRRAG
jgi:sRNA-binding protein